MTNLHKRLSALYPTEYSLEVDLKNAIRIENGFLNDLLGLCDNLPMDRLDDKKIKEYQNIFERNLQKLHRSKKMKNG
jgi:hypothetical protein